jgi:hypothetical protein
VLRTASAAHGKCQFGEGEHGVFASDIVPKTLALFLKQSTYPQRRHNPLARWNVFG